MYKRSNILWLVLRTEKYPLPIMHKGGGHATKITKIIFTDFIIRGMSSRHLTTGILNHRLKPEIDGNKR